MSELNFKMGTKTSTVPSSGTSGEIFFTTDENKYGHIYFIDRKNKIINVIPNLLDIAHGGTGATTAAAALTNLGLTATATELNYVKGATSSLQTQLNNKSEKNHTHDYLSLTGGAITGKMDLTSFPNVDDNYKMGKTSGASGGIHFKKKDGQNDYGNAITWSYSNNDESHAGIYVKSSGSYGTKMYFATTSSFSAGAMAALEIDHAGNISALRGNFKGDLTGNASTATKASSLKYHSTLQTDEAIDGFLEANALKSAIWGSTSSPGTSNGIIISGGYASTNYGFQLAIDDDPTYFMALRQKGTNGWNEWKCIPMADGTGASGTWGIGITGNAATATKATQDGSGNTITSTYATKTELNTTKSNLQSSIDGKLSLSGGTMTGSIILPTNDDMGIIPSTNNYGQIGSSDKQFYRMYAKNFYGSLQGNATSATSATTATKAIQDASGNTITSTYATKTELNTAKSTLQTSIDGKLPLSGGTMTGALTVNNTLKAYSIITDPYHVGIGSGGTGWYRIYTNTFNNASGKATCSFTIGRNYNSPMNEEYSFVVSVGYNGQMNITQLTGCVGGHIITKIRVVYKNSSTFYIDFYTTPNEYKNEYYICGSGTGTFQTPALVSSIGDGYSTYEFETVNGCKSDKGFTGDLTGNASTATTATNIKDYNGDYKIQIGYNGSGISGDQIAYIAGYTNSNGIKIKDVSKSALQSWLGLGSAAYTASTAYATSGHTHNYAGSSSAGGSATSAVKLDTATAGSATQPAYFSGGKPVACTYTLGKSVPSNAVFTDTTYSAATQSAQGLMSAADKKKLDGIASGANAYSLPTASSSTLGGVKTTSTVTSTSGLTACPIISGVPYYKDTNTTYSLSSFGITATAAELNYTDGVTSNIQTQLNGKVDLSSTQTVSGVKTFSNGIKIGNTTMSYDSTNKRLVISVT